MEVKKVSNVQPMNRTKHESGRCENKAHFLSTKTSSSNKVRVSSLSCEHYQYELARRLSAQYWNLIIMLRLGRIVSVLLLIFGDVCGFNEESIFEDEDIYKQALPPVPHTGITAPGTKWCGPGNTAVNYNDLGTQHETDKCCRAHDHCEEIMEPQTALHSLQNPDWFPILKCTCEQQFINCLQVVNNMASNTMGRVYFGTRSKCFGLGHPILGCKEHQEGTFRKRCIRYNVDKKKSKLWQFYDMPFYSHASATMLSRNLLNT